MRTRLVNAGSRTFNDFRAAAQLTLHLILAISTPKIQVTLEPSIQHRTTRQPSSNLSTSSGGKTARPGESPSAVASRHRSASLRRPRSVIFRSRDNACNFHRAIRGQRYAANSTSATRTETYIYMYIHTHTHRARGGHFSFIRSIAVERN